MLVLPRNSAEGTPHYELESVGACHGHEGIIGICGTNDIESGESFVDLAESRRPWIELEAGVFCAARMRISRAGVGVAARRAHVRLGATSGPPAIRIFPGLAHFHTAAAGLGFRALAITAPRGGATQRGRRVGKKRQRTGKEECGNEKPD